MGLVSIIGIYHLRSYLFPRADNLRLILYGAFQCRPQFQNLQVQTADAASDIDDLASGGQRGPVET